MTKKQRETLFLIHAALVLSCMDNADRALCKAFPWLKDQKKRHKWFAKKKKRHA